jgi:hypothetical protein
MQKLVDLFSQAPASLSWSLSEDGTRRIGTSEGFILTLGATIEAAAIFPPDREDIAARNGTLLLLLLTALRPDWQTAGDWLAQQMRLARGSKHLTFEGPNYSRRVTFVWDRRHSRATLKVG